MNNFNDLINLFWSCLWIVGCVSSILLITLILMKRMIVGKTTYRGYSSSNKKAMGVALFSSITSNNDDGKD
jgi:preprotein translocase subunit SecG